jgi:hypothetical protein
MARLVLAACVWLEYAGADHQLIVFSIQWLCTIAESNLVRWAATLCALFSLPIPVPAVPAGFQMDAATPRQPEHQGFQIEAGSSPLDAAAKMAAGSKTPKQPKWFSGSTTAKMAPVPAKKGTCHKTLLVAQRPAKPRAPVPLVAQRPAKPRVSVPLVAQRPAKPRVPRTTNRPLVLPAPLGHNSCNPQHASTASTLCGNVAKTCPANP